MTNKYITTNVTKKSKENAMGILDQLVAAIESDFSIRFMMPIAGVYGRILRGKQPEDFATLSDDPTRKVVMLMGPVDLEMMARLPAAERLVQIGYETEYIRRKIAEGNQFKIVLFDHRADLPQATWDNVFDAISR